MSAFDQIQFEMPARLIELETRVQQLEAALSQMRGEPVPPAFGLWMLRTQALPTLAAEGTATTAAATVTTAAAAADNNVVEIDPALFKTRKMPRGPMPPATFPTAAPLTIDAALLELASIRTTPAHFKVVSALEENYPGIMHRITGMWQAPQARGPLRSYVKKLLDEEYGPRHGFDPAAVTELKMLTSILAEQERETRWGMAPEAA